MNASISHRAMLVNLSISAWTARKHDRRVDQTVDAHYKATGAGRFNKILIAEEAIKAVDKTANAGRTYHYEQTLPWTDQGQRLLPVANFQTYSAEMRKLRAEFDSAVSAFASNYDALVDDARLRLNGLFRGSDYPQDIRSRFGWSVTILPVPTGQDLRVDLAEAELAAIQAEITEHTQAAVQAAHADLYRRLAEAVGHMADKLGDKDAIFRDSLVENLAELCELLPRLDLVGDPQLAELRRKVEKKLLRHEPQELREDSGARARTARDAAAILKAMEGMYGQP